MLSVANWKLLLLAMLIFFLSACGGGSGTVHPEGGAPANTNKSLTLGFSAVANQQDVTCGTTITGLGSAGTDVTFQDFRFFIHDVRLVKDSGEEVAVTLDQNIWQHSNVALIDFQNKADKCGGADKPVHDYITATYVDDGVSSYTGVKFIVGLPATLNHNNPAQAPSPLNITSLQWNWQAGYKFMRIDVAPVGGISRPSDPEYVASAWNFHLGSTDCSGDPVQGEIVSCGRANRPEVSLSGFTLGVSEIVVDYGALVEASVLSLDNAGAPGCMSGATDPECASVFERLGLDMDTGNVISATAQRVFRIE